MNILEAQRTRVVRVPSLLDAGEVALLLALGEQVQACRRPTRRRLSPSRTT